MKFCPNCQQTYYDESLNFCLNCGTLLESSNDAPPTVMMDEPRTTVSDLNPGFSNPPSAWQDQSIQNQPPYAPPLQPGSFGQTTGTNQNLPIISLILGGCSLVVSFCCSFFGIPFGIGAIITGFLGMNQANNAPQQYGGKNLAIVGMILGGISILVVLGLLFVSFLVR